MDQYSCFSGFLPQNHPIFARQILPDGHIPVTCSLKNTAYCRRLGPADLHRQPAATAQRTAIGGGNVLVKGQPLMRSFQCHFRLKTQFRLQGLHLVAGHIGRIGKDQIQRFRSQLLLVAEHISCHRPHRRMLRARAGQSPGSVPSQIGKGIRAFFQAGDPGGGNQPLQPKANTAAAGAQIQNLRFLFARQQLGAGLAQKLGVRPGISTPGPTSSSKSRKGHRPARYCSGYRCARFSTSCSSRFFCAFGQLAVHPAPVSACHQLHQAGCIEGGILHTGLFQPGPRPGMGSPGRAAYHSPSSGRLGSTGFTAAMATSIMESSGSKVVSR